PGDFYEFPPFVMDHNPVQKPGPPVLLGGAADAALRRAGRLAAGWVSSSRADLGALGRSVGVVREAAEKAGRDPEELRMVCRGAVRVRPDGTGGAGGGGGAGGPDRPLLTGTIDQVRDDFGRLAGQGVTELFVDLNFDPALTGPDADPAASMDRAREALEAFAPKP
ncbi:LLM class flavin-dependent oxidoreductase, partial [Spirillospora sp. NPDC049652]